MLFEFYNNDSLKSLEGVRMPVIFVEFTWVEENSQSNENVKFK